VYSPRVRFTPPARDGTRERYRTKRRRELAAMPSLFEIVETRERAALGANAPCEGDALTSSDSSETKRDPPRALLAAAGRRGRAYGPSRKRH
jgi:hypothetical protein